MRRVLSILCAAAAVICLCVWIWQNEFIQTYFEQKKYEAVSKEYTVSPKPVIRVDSEEIRDPMLDVEYDFAGLKKRNSDIVAWVVIPGTVIDYPVVWREGDIDYYLHRNIDKKRSTAGSIFMDGACKEDMSSRHNLFYGHHMVNQSMFFEIVRFKKEDFFLAHRDVYVYTPQKVHKLKTIACLYTTAGSDKRKTEFKTQQELTRYIDESTKGCRFRDLPDENIGRLWSFITCSYEKKNTRTILYCYEPGPQDPFPAYVPEGLKGPRNLSKEEWDRHRIKRIPGKELSYQCERRITGNTGNLKRRSERSKPSGKR